MTADWCPSGRYTNTTDELFRKKKNEKIIPRSWRVKKKIPLNFWEF